MRRVCAFVYVNVTYLLYSDCASDHVVVADFQCAVCATLSLSYSVCLSLCDVHVLCKRQSRVISLYQDSRRIGDAFQWIGDQLPPIKASLSLRPKHFAIFLAVRTML